VTLTFDCDLKIALPVTPEVGNVSSKFERCVVFRFRANGDGHRTDGRTDRRTDELGVKHNAVSYNNCSAVGRKLLA